MNQRREWEHWNGLSSSVLPLFRFYINWNVCVCVCVSCIVSTIQKQKIEKGMM